MSARSIGEVLAAVQSAKATRCYQPVRRNSFHAHDRRALGIWQPIARNGESPHRLISESLKAAQRYNELKKGAGERQGPLGDVGMRLLRELSGIVDYKTGRLEPALETLCKRINRSRSTVVKYLAKLKLHGFLDWVRRTEPTGNEGAGPQVRQITNAYRLTLPPIAAAWVAEKLYGGPLPEDWVWRVEAEGAEIEAMLDTATVDEQVRFIVGDATFAASMVKLGEGLARDSASSLNGQNPYQDNINTRSEDRSAKAA